MSAGLLESVETDLESMLDDLAPCDWKRGHESTGTECTSEAVVLMWQDCTKGTKWRACASALAWVDFARGTHSVCANCERPPAVCWRTVPI